MNDKLIQKEREAHLLLQKTWVHMPNEDIDQVKNVCIEWLDKSLDIGLDFVSNPNDALEYVKKINEIKHIIKTI
jgi:hypothetical protein